ncbi:MAG: hypothetical protein ACP5XB_29700, partial [Isosphaeraceae bacterium]
MSRERSAFNPIKPLPVVGLQSTACVDLSAGPLTPGEKFMSDSVLARLLAPGPRVRVIRPGRPDPL